MTQARSGTVNAQESLQEILDSCEGSAKSTTLKNLQQYETPEWLSYLCASLLPSVPQVAFDPQCASRRLLTPYISTFGVDLDRKHSNEMVSMLTCSSAQFWEIIDDVWPKLRFECQVANPPFGLKWKTPDGPTDSTEYTWRKMRERTALNGFGFMIASRKTIDKYGWKDEDEVYLYMTIPVGVWKDCNVELGVLFWKQGVSVTAEELHIDDLDFWSGMTIRQASTYVNGLPSIKRAKAELAVLAHKSWIRRVGHPDAFDGVSGSSSGMMSSSWTGSTTATPSP